MLARLREIDPAVCAIASSGSSSDPAMSDPGSHGFAAPLPKPYTMDEAAAALGRARGL